MTLWKSGISPWSLSLSQFHLWCSPPSSPRVNPKVGTGAGGRERREDQERVPGLPSQPAMREKTAGWKAPWPVGHDDGGQGPASKGDHRRGDPQGTLSSWSLLGFSLPRALDSQISLLPLGFSLLASSPLVTVFDWDARENPEVTRNLSGGVLMARARDQRASARHGR